MKKLSLFLLIILSPLMFCACANSTQNLAKNLDDTVTNLVYTVSSLDWVNPETLENLTTQEVEMIPNNDSQISQIPNTTIQEPIANINNGYDVNNYMTDLQANSDPYYYQQKMNPQMSGSAAARAKLSKNTISKVPTTSQSTTIKFNTDAITELNKALMVDYSTETLEEQTSEVLNVLKTLIEKRANILIYVNALYNKTITLDNETITAIKAYINIIKDNTSYLNSNKGIITNQLNQAQSIKASNSYSPLVNAYIIRTSEAIDTRLAKLSASILAIDSIMDILDANSPINLLTINNKQNKINIPTETNTNNDTSLNNTNEQDINPNINVDNIDKISTENNSANNGQNNDENKVETDNITQNSAENQNVNPHSNEEKSENTNINKTEINIDQSSTNADSQQPLKFIDESQQNKEDNKSGQLDLIRIK